MDTSTSTGNGKKNGDGKDVEYMNMGHQQRRLNTNSNSSGLSKQADKTYGLHCTSQAVKLGPEHMKAGKKSLSSCLKCKTISLSSFCNHCEKAFCDKCISTCSICTSPVCTFSCSIIDYSQADGDRVLCLDCKNSHSS